jgi:hypothetical protein
VLLDRIEDELLFDEILIQEFLVIGPDGALERVRNPEVFGGNQARARFECDLQDSAPHIHLKKVSAVLPERYPGKLRGI